MEKREENISKRSLQQEDGAKSASALQYERMTNTPVNRLILSLSVPAIISMMISNIYNLVDTAFVGRLGTSASGAVGIVFGFMAIIQAFGFMLGQGGGSIVARALGEKNAKKADRFASISFLFSFLFGMLITAIGFIWLDEVVHLLGSTPTIAPFAKDYIFYILIASPFMSSSLTLNNILRYEGKAMLGMFGILIGAILNMVGDPIFMFGLNMGISGAGLATALSQMISWGILLSMFLRGKTQAKIQFYPFNAEAVLDLMNICATGLPSLIRQVLTSFTTVMLNLECKVYGDEAVAAMSIVSRVMFMSFSIALGICQGFQPVSAFNYGAKKYKRVRSAFWVTNIFSEVIVIIGASLIMFFSGEIIQIFRNDPKVIEIGTRALVLNAIAQFFLPVSVGIEMLFQSTGERLQASILSTIRSGLLFIPLLWTMARLRGLAGIQEAQPLAVIIALPICIPFLIRFLTKMPKEDQE